jgi:hypothetical protein
MIRSFTEVLPHFRSNQPEVLVDGKIAATIPRQGSPVKIKPYLCKRQRHALDIFRKTKERPTRQTPAVFFV